MCPTNPPATQREKEWKRRERTRADGQCTWNVVVEPVVYGPTALIFVLLFCLFFFSYLLWWWWWWWTDGWPTCWSPVLASSEALQHYDVPILKIYKSSFAIVWELDTHTCAVGVIEDDDRDKGGPWVTMAKPACWFWGGTDCCWSWGAPPDPGGLIVCAAHMREEEEDEDDDDDDGEEHEDEDEQVEPMEWQEEKQKGNERKERK